MKHSMFVLLFTCVFSSILAQESPSAKWLVGGSLSLSFDKSDNFVYSTVDGTFYRESTRNQYAARPYIGKQLNEQWLIAFAPSYSNAVIKTDEHDILGTLFAETESKTSSFGASIFARYTINPSDRFNIFLRPNFNFSGGKSISKRANETFRESKTTTWSTGIGFGFLYQLSDRLNVTTSIGGFSYRSSSSKDQLNDSDDRNSKRFGFNINASTTFFGFEYKF